MALLAGHPFVRSLGQILKDSSRRVERLEESSRKLQRLFDRLSNQLLLGHQLSKALLVLHLKLLNQSVHFRLRVQISAHTLEIQIGLIAGGRFSCSLQQALQMNQMHPSEVLVNLFADVRRECLPTLWQWQCAVLGSRRGNRLETRQVVGHRVKEGMNGHGIVLRVALVQLLTTESLLEASHCSLVSQMDQVERQVSELLPVGVQISLQLQRAIL